MKRLILFGLLVIAFSAASGRILNVPDQFPTIQAGIDSSANGDTVLVAEGEYRERINYNGHNIVVASLFITTGQDYYIYHTIINAAHLGSAITIQGLNDTISAIIGMTIQQGTANNGGGIYCLNSLMRIYHNNINSNVANSALASNGKGGGIFCDSSNLRIIGNLINSNIARGLQHNCAFGAGLYFSSSTALISDNIFNSNNTHCDSTYGGDGGAIYSLNSNGIIDNNIIENNNTYVLDYGGCGAGIYLYNSIYDIINNTISSNSTHSLYFYGHGGGIYAAYSTLNIINNTIENNNTNGYNGGYEGHGGGICVYTTTMQVFDNIIRNNNAVAYGGGAYIGSGTSKFKNNMITGNSAGSRDGGGIYIDEGTISFINNTLAGNNARLGGGIARNRPNTRLFANNTIAFNSAQESGGGTYNINNIINSIIWGNSAPQDSQIYPNTAIIAYSDVSGGWLGEYNISQNPLFRDPVYHLSSINCGDSTNSPCIDRGSFIIGDSILDCNWGLGSYRSDMGAYGGSIVLSRPLTILHVPGDYSSIQMAISNCLSGDTILVEPGIYLENINFFGKNATVASRYLLTGDTSFISSTIIDGNLQGSAVSFDHGETNNALLTGFTIRNGHSSLGGGIYCDFSDPTILHNKLLNNSADSMGGGIYCNYSLGVIKNNLVKDNDCSGSGGGIVCDGSVYWNYRSPYVVDNLILNNSGTKGAGVFCRHSNAYLVGNIISNNMGLNGGGLYIENCGPKVFNNVFYSNSADSSAGGLYLGSAATPNISNSIIRNNNAPTNPEIFVNSGNRFSLNYSNISGGWQGVGNVDIDPLFRSVGNSDFHLVSIACGDSANSPCIDLGDPILFDTLLTCDWGLGIERSDMGAYGGGRVSQLDVNDNTSPSLPLTFSLSQNYPNPFNPATTIKYDLPSPCRVRIDIYDILGRRVATLADEEQVAGAHQVIWNASDKSSGIYFYRIQAGEYVETKKMMLMK
jgi:hypothetical protein